MNFSKFADFEIKSSSLKDIRDFSKKVFKENQELENEQEKLILAIAEAAQNILKHAYENKNSSDKLRLQISYDDNELTIDLYDKGKLTIEKNVNPRKLDDIKPGGLGTFFIKQVMDEVIFSKSKNDDWVNHLILKKKNYPPIIAPTLKIGEYIAIIKPPIMVPIKTIIIGSIKVDILSTAVSNSSS